jgi:T5SS/PEP-CTERM-associated repeat protein
MQEARRHFLTLVVLISFYGWLQTATGQYTSNFQTNTISGVASYWSGDYVVGSNTLADVLLIKSGGTLATADGYVGYLAASVSNSVMVAGAGSVWTNGFMYLGYSGGWNTMVISNAGNVVETGQGTYVGYDTTSSSNRVLVTGTNSIWNGAGHFFIGNAGSGNSLVITNGGQVASGIGYVGEDSISTNNSVLVTGANSVWNNSSCLIGDNGSNNRMTINKGGRVVCGSAQLGYFGSASGNSVWVSDTNSVWDVSATAAILSVGLTGSDNSVVVTNGAQLLGYYVYVGNYPSSGNSMVVTGPGSSLTVNCYVYTGNQGNNNSFTLTRAATVSDKFCYISYVAGSSNNAVLLADPNTSWQNSYSVFVGFDGVAGSLTISNGATMSTGGAFTTSHDGALGVNADSSNNRALITGKGSFLNIADNMFIGLNGPSNNLVVNNGGRIMDTTGYIGCNPGSDNNSVLVAGTNSVWTNGTDMYVGKFSLNNSLMISNGARVFNVNGYVGRTSGSGSNNVIVTGAGSVWINNNTNLYVGCYGSANSIVINNGGRVNDDWGTIGFDTNSIGNQAIVDGTNSVWANSTVVFVGDFGSTNSLTIRNSGLVTDSYGLIGEEDSGNGNTAYVQSGGTWRNDQLCVGDLGSENSMFVDGGSVFVTTYMAVGFNPIYYDNLCQLNTGLIAVTNQTHDAELEVYGGEFVLAGGTLTVDTLVVTNAGAMFIHTGGTLIYRNLQLDPNQSVVGDGIPNWWKQQYGLDPFDPNVANADPDHDGMSNLQEYLAGTNPTNAASCLKITSVTMTNGNVRVSWSAVGGKSYVLQTNSILGSAFADASPVITVPGTGQVVTNYLDLGNATGNATRLYRIRLGP